MQPPPPPPSPAIPSGGMCKALATQWQGKALGGPGIENACIGHVWTDRTGECMASLVTAGDVFTPRADGGADVSTHGGQIRHVLLSDAIKQMQVLPPTNIMLKTASGDQQSFPCSKISVVPSGEVNPCIPLAKKWEGKTFGGSGRQQMCLAHVWSDKDNKCMASFVTAGDVYSPRPDGGAAVSTHGGQVKHMLLDEALRMPMTSDGQFSLKSSSGVAKSFPCSQISVVQPSSTVQ